MANYEGFDHLKPNYELIFAARVARLKQIRETPGMLGGLLEHYKDHPVDFINDWAMTVDPRNAEVGLPVTIPFVLFKKQAEFVDWVVERWKGREDGLAEKSRDMGVSWLCCWIAIWMWRFHPGTIPGFGSRKEEYVDKIGDPKSLFWKIREGINKLPKEFRPAGYTEQQHAPFMRIINPENGSVIIGEAGDNIGRGNRTSIYFKDESAFYERPDAIDAALSQTSNCKIDVSTPNGNGNPFFRKRHSGKIKVFTFHWTDDPRKDQAWYDAQKEKYDPVIIAQEIDIDYNASVGDAWVSGQLILDAQAKGPADVQAVGQWAIGVDAAHFGDDESIIHSRKGRLNLPQVAVRGLDGIQLAGRVEEHCRSIEQSGGKIGVISIELDGPGVSCFDQLRAGRYRKVVKGVHTGARLSDNRNFNIRARLHRRAKEYLEDGPVSIHNDPEFRAQGSSIKFGYRDGLLLMQDKKTYKKLFGRSPDRWDAFVLTFVDFANADDSPEEAPMPQMGTGSWMR